MLIHSTYQLMACLRGSSTGPEYGPLPPAKGSDVWALKFVKVYEGSPSKGPILRDHETRMVGAPNPKP